MKIYNQIQASLCAAVMAAGLSSCGSEWLDQFPADGVDAETAIQTVGDLDGARTGMYAGLKGNSNMTNYYAANMFVYGEVHGEDIQYEFNGGSNRASFYYYMEYKTADDFTRTNSVWQSPYVVIGRANRIIEGAETIADDDEDKWYADQLLNEAKVLRALALFDLTRIYGKPYTMDNGASLGVPVITTSIEANEKPSRSSVKDCYTQIVKDLTEAIASNALAEDDSEPCYINLWAAKAILSRVYLYMGLNDEALSVAEDIIQNSPYELWTVDQYANAWSENSASHGNEVIFEIAITNTDDWTDRNGIAYLYAEDSSKSPGYGDMVATKSFVEMLKSDPNDVRNDVFVVAEDPDLDALFEGNKVYLNKFPPVNGDVRYADIPLLRLSEVYLNAAEAAFASNKKDKAADYLNAIIQNRTTDASKSVTAGDITAERIYIERRKELVGEGHRFFDAMRRGETITRYTSEADKGWHDVLKAEARSYDRNSPLALPAIPQYERNANPNIEQNPGY